MSGCNANYLQCPIEKRIICDHRQGCYDMMSKAVFVGMDDRIIPRNKK